jgi:hypothetical protein
MKNKFTETRSEEIIFWEDSNNILWDINNLLEQFNEEIEKILR